MDIYDHGYQQYELAKMLAAPRQRRRGLAGKEMTQERGNEMDHQNFLFYLHRTRQSTARKMRYESEDPLWSVAERGGRLARRALTAPRRTLAGWLTVAGFLGIAVLQAYWAAGGRWGAQAVLGENTSIPPTPVLWLAALAPLLAVTIVLGRLGTWGDRFPQRIFTWGTWVIAGMMVLISAGNFAGGTAWEVLLLGPVALLFGVLCGLVARTSDLA